MFWQATYAPNPPFPAGPGSCNLLLEDGCNPLTANRFATPPEAYNNEETDEAAAIRTDPPAAEQHSDPYAMFRDTYASANRADPYAMYRHTSASASLPASDLYVILGRYMDQPEDNDPYSSHVEAAPEYNHNDPFSAIHVALAATHRHSPPTPWQQYPSSSPSYEEPAQPLGPPGKTKEGYDCFIGYDHECYPSTLSDPQSGARPCIPYTAEAYEPHLNVGGTRHGVLEPANPHCDPEYDPDCRLCHYEPEQTQVQPKHHAKKDHNQEAAETEQQPEHQEQEYEAEPSQSGQEEPHMSDQLLPQSVPSLQDILRGYGDHYPEQDDHRAYADD